MGKLAALNLKRASEELEGRVAWLRPEFQKSRLQARLPNGATRDHVSLAQLAIPWPKDLPEQVAAVRDTLWAAPGMLSAEDVANAYAGASVKRVIQALRTLEALGDAARHKNGTVRWKGLAKVTSERSQRMAS